MTIPYLGLGLLSGGVVLVAEDAMSVAVAHELPMLVHVRMGVLPLPDEILAGPTRSKHTALFRRTIEPDSRCRRARILSQEVNMTHEYLSHSGVGRVVGGRRGGVEAEEVAHWSDLGPGNDCPSH